MEKEQKECCCGLVPEKRNPSAALSGQAGRASATAFGREVCVPCACGAGHGFFAGANFSRSSQTISSTSEEFEKAHVAEELELLADFGADVAVARVPPPQVFLEGVHFRKRKFFLPKRLGHAEHIERPAPHAGTDSFQWFEVLELSSHMASV